MYSLSSNITIGDYHLRRVHEAVIQRSTRTLTDTCTLKLPTTARLKKKDITTSVELHKTFQVGDKICI